MDISFILYSQNGLFNQFSSFQLMAAFSGYFKNYIINVINKENFYKIQDPQKDYHNFLDTSKIDKIVRDEKASLLDLIDYDIPNITIYPNDYHFKNRENSNIIHAQLSYIDNGIDERYINDFAFGRNKIILDESRHNIITMTLVWYSLFFTQRNYFIDTYIQSVKFKKEYLLLADKIKNELGKFNGSHLRLMRDHWQYYTFDYDKTKNGLSKFDDDALPLYLSVDDINSNNLKYIDKRYKMIHEIILNDFKTDFLSLPYSNRVTLGLISALVMSKADDFVGTPLSTFTAFIHQQRCRNNLSSFKFFPSSFDLYNENYKPYSWNSLPKDIYTWQREFKECYINV